MVLLKRFLRSTPGLMGQGLEEAFQYEVLKMLKKEGKISDAIIGNMLSVSGGVKMM